MLNLIKKKKFQPKFQVDFFPKFLAIYLHILHNHFYLKIQNQKKKKIIFLTITVLCFPISSLSPFVYFNFRISGRGDDGGAPVFNGFLAQLAMVDCAGIFPACRILVAIHFKSLYLPPVHPRLYIPRCVFPRRRFSTVLFSPVLSRTF